MSLALKGLSKIAYYPRRQDTKLSFLTSSAFKLGGICDICSSVICLCNGAISTVLLYCSTTCDYHWWLLKATCLFGLRNIAVSLGMEKLEWCGYPMVKKLKMHYVFIRFDRIHERDRQTDEQTDTAQRRRLRLCIASRGKNAHFVFSGSQTVSSTHCSYPQRGKVR